MTICLALACDDRKSIVAVADRMVSVGSLSLQFEQGTRKIERLGESFAVLTAGDALGHTDLLRQAAAEIAGMAEPGVKEVATVVEGCFVEHRQILAEKLVLHPIRLSYNGFVTQQQSLPPDMVVGLWREYQRVELELELLVVGVDSSGARLYHVGDPGIAVCFDSIGYAAIGSGLPHAQGFLAEADYSPGISLNRAVWLAYVAKRRSERAPGVGSRFTDILVIKPDQEAGFLDAQSLEHLGSIYQNYGQKLTDASHAVEQPTAELSLTLEPAEGGEMDG